MLTVRCINEKKSNVSYTLLVGQTYTIGRKGGDISFPDDQSVSRNHAEVTVEHPLANVSDPLLIPTVVITDLGSKFGTFANDGIERRSQMAMREPMNLSPGDRFRFGLQWNEFLIEYTPLIVTPSTLKAPLQLKNVIMSLGGHVIPEWSQKCDYVVMESLTLTIKAVCAMLAGKPIVTPSFFNDLIECVQTKKGLPNPNNYLPPIGEKTLSGEGLSFEPNESRSQLFVGKTFLFATQKHLRKMGVAVQCGGGKAALITSATKSQLADENFIIMNPSNDYALLDNSTQKAIDIYKKAKKRFIQDSEIGLAAVNMSTNKHCNPFYSMKDAVFPKQLGSQTQTSQNSASKVIVPETQDQPTQLSTASSQSSRNIVEETFIATGKIKDEPVSESDSSSIAGPSGSSKRHATENGKDKVSDVNDDAPPTSKKRSAGDFLVPKASASKRLRSDVQSQNALSALFCLSDDDEDDNETGAEEAMVVEATPQTGQGVRENQDSETLNPYEDPSLEVLSPSIDRVPDSPEIINLSEDEDDIERKVDEPLIETSSPPVESRTIRSRTKQMAQSNSSTSKGQTKRKRLNSEETPVTSAVSKIRKTSSPKKNLNESNDLTTKASKLTIKPEVKKEEDNKDGILPVAPPVPVVFIEVLQQPKVQPKVQLVDGKTVKNFKTFQKVLPLSQRHQNSEISGRSSEASKNSFSGKKLTYELFEHRPTMVTGNSYGPSSPLPQVNERRNIIVDSDDDNMEFDDAPSTSSAVRSPRRQPTRQDKSEHSVSKTRAAIQETPPPLLHTAFDDDDDEDDIWKFD